MPIKAYKGFNKDMTCRGFQFEEGKTYEEETAELCMSGFHACLNPLDCFKYYTPATSVFHEVELDDVCDKRDQDTKVSAKKIKIGEKLNVAKICKLHFEFVKSQTTEETCGGDRSSLSGGNRSSLSGGDGSSLSGGDRSSLSGGNRSSLSGGNRSSLSGGNRSSLSGRGKAQAKENSLICVRGDECMAKGGLGSLIVIVNENDYSYDIIEWKAGVIDGETLKPDTWYKLKDGKFVEVEEE